MRSRIAAATRLALWTAGLVVVARVLRATGPGPLGLTVESVDALSAWVERATPVDAVLAILRTAAVLATWYLLGATVLAVVAGLVRADPLTAAVQRVTPGVVRRLATGGGGVGLLVGGAVASLPVPDASPPRTAIVAPAGPETEVATMTRAGPAGPSPGRATMARVDAPPAAATMTRVDLAVGTPAAGPAPPATPTGWSPAPDPAPPAGEATSWVVEPGDSFWSIAEDVVGGERERAVGRYWRTLVEANRSRLVDPSNPDLLVPGQELTLPDPEPPDP
jgi:hypothetical protein